MKFTKDLLRRKENLYGNGSIFIHNCLKDDYNTKNSTLECNY